MQSILLPLSIFFQGQKELIDNVLGVETRKNYRLSQSTLSRETTKKTLASEKQYIVCFMYISSISILSSTKKELIDKDLGVETRKN